MYIYTYTFISFKDVKRFIMTMSKILVIESLGKEFSLRNYYEVTLLPSL